MKKYFTEEERKEAKKLYDKRRYNKEIREKKRKNAEKLRRVKGILPRNEWLKTCPYQTEEERKEARRQSKNKWKRNHQSEVKEYIKNNIEKIKLYRKEYRKKNREKITKRDKQYRKENRNKINQQLKKRRETDINYKLAIVLRNRIRSAIKKNYKSGSAVRDLGCSIPELKIYLESKFQEEMSWENYGFYGWHIDHIVPLGFFNLQNREEFLKACHYTNLQPLWAKENLQKGNKIQ